MLLNDGEGCLIIDSGGGSTRVMLSGADGRIIDGVSITNEFETNGISVSFDPRLWIVRIRDAISTLIRRNPGISIRAYSAASAREGIVLIDRDGKAFLGLPNSDKRGADIAERFPDSRFIYEKTGKWCDPLFSAFKLAGLRQDDPDTYARIEAFTSISEWIGYELTGCIGMEHSHACETLLYDTAARQWSDELIEALEISPEMLPPLVESGTVLGYVSDGVPFIVTGADTQAAALSCSGSSYEMVLISGTTSPLVMRLDAPSIDSSERFWLDCDICGGWLAEVNTGASGINIQNYISGCGHEISLDDIDNTIGHRESFSYIASYGSKLFFRGRSAGGKGILRLPAGGLSYTSLEAGCLSDADDADIIAALRMDIAFGIAENVRLLEELFPDKGHGYIAACGGGMNSEIQGQWIADACGRRVVVRENYAQASTDGCRRIIARHLGYPADTRKKVREYMPRADSPILEYLDSWSRLRSDINGITD